MGITFSENSGTNGRYELGKDVSVTPVRREWNRERRPQCLVQRGQHAVVGHKSQKTIRDSFRNHKSIQNIIWIRLRRGRIR